MKTITEHIRDRLLAEVNRPPLVDLPTMLETQWDAVFVRYMRNRMAFGGYRYGRIRDPDQPLYDNVGSLQHRARLYLETGNTEHLVDIANLAMIEFVRGCCHPNPIWDPQDDGYHAERL